MAICRWAGPSDLFHTFTCNPKCPKIKEFLKLIPGQRSEDRPNIISRVFKIKLDQGNILNTLEQNCMMRDVIL
ncbi:DNA helicase PIF1, ATP-dependent [Gossypium australe]|uniref:DNA helicase PIF1, ATP-dependent n=1 Tax=Gossypium australe TaxID=47621 RepID=A0A5B6WEG5_9ROSI|nr:DNA helicase PIF1, ATP-dependent [Gossypium australe]